jgi:hypothetical protein
VLAVRSAYLELPLAVFLSLVCRGTSGLRKRPEELPFLTETSPSRIFNSPHLSENSASNSTFFRNTRHYSSVAFRFFLPTARQVVTRETARALQHFNASAVEPCLQAFTVPTPDAGVPVLDAVSVVIVKKPLTTTTFTGKFGDR